MIVIRVDAAAGGREGVFVDITFRTMFPNETAFIPYTAYG